jgi:methionyl-tRNA formyltransferase
MEKSNFLKINTRIVYFGTPRFAAEILRYLFNEGVSVVGVVTQPDRPQGRSKQPVASPVKQVAQECFPSIPVLQPEKASNEEFLQDLFALKGDLFVVVAYGQILSQTLLSHPPKGCINIHASLLPKYRGAAPMQRCLLAGEQETGVSIQKMVKQLDAGDIIATTKINIPREMNVDELENRLCEISKPLLLQVLCEFDQGIPPSVGQDHSLATYAAKISPAEGEIVWADSAERIHDLIRAFSPRPGGWTWMDSKRKKMKILASRIVSDIQGIPGEILSQDGVVACGVGALQILEVQPEGKKAMSWSQWYRGSSLKGPFPISFFG